MARSLYQVLSLASRSLGAPETGVSGLSVRPIRRADRAMNLQETRELLARAPVGRLGTVGPDGWPYVTPLHFVFWDGKLYFHSAREGHKMENLEAHPRVCFEVDEFHGIRKAPSACSYASHYESAIAFGRARPVADDDRKLVILRRFLAKYGAEATSIEPSSVASTAVIEIQVERLTGKWAGRPPAARETDSPPGPGASTPG